MAGQNGGARPGAGRKRKATKYETAIQKAEKQLADTLPALIDNLTILANGGYERIEEEWVPAGLVTVGAGEHWRLAFPNEDPDKLVMVKRKSSIADKDRSANTYLVDRVMGKPIQKVAPTTPDGKDSYDNGTSGTLELIYSRINQLAAGNQTKASSGGAD
jgi:hypothetical protein